MVIGGLDSRLVGGNIQVQPRFIFSRVGKALFFCWRMWRGCYKSVRQSMSMMIHYPPRGARSVAILQVEVNCLFCILDFLRITGTISSILFYYQLTRKLQVKSSGERHHAMLVMDVCSEAERCLGCCIFGASRRNDCWSTSIMCLMVNIIGLREQKLFKLLHAQNLSFLQCNRNPTRSWKVPVPMQTFT